MFMYASPFYLFMYIYIDVLRYSCSMYTLNVFLGCVHTCISIYLQRLRCQPRGANHVCFNDPGDFF